MNKNLLNKELEEYEKMGYNMIPVSYNKKLISNLIENSSDFGMTEIYYCCNGEKQCCWEEIVEEGVWDLTKEEVECEIKNLFKHIKKYLYNKTKYGSRIYISKNKKCCRIFIYCRDKNVKADYDIWFKNK